MGDSLEGGALALAVAGVPRGTADVDVNVFLSEDRVGLVIAVLEKMGMEIDVPKAIAKAHEEGLFVARWDGMRIDVFFPSIPFAREAERTRVRVTDMAGWIVEMMGEDDERTGRWDEIVARFATA